MHNPHGSIHAVVGDKQMLVATVFWKYRIGSIVPQYALHMTCCFAVPLI